MTRIKEAWIVGAVRTPVGRHGGALSAVRPDVRYGHVHRGGASRWSSRGAGSLLNGTP